MRERGKKRRRDNKLHTEREIERKRMSEREEVRVNMKIILLEKGNIKSDLSLY